MGIIKCEKFSKQRYETHGESCIDAVFLVESSQFFICLMKMAK